MPTPFLTNPFRAAVEWRRGLREGELFLAATRALQLVLTVCSAFAAWNGLKLLLGNAMPIVVVLSGSMEPGFQRGDILSVGRSEANSALAPGDIVVYSLQNKVIPIVHRVLERRAVGGGEAPGADSLWRAAGPEGGPLRLAYLTKGDANPVHDTFLYTTGKGYVEPREVVGRVGAYLPGVGYLTIAMKEHLWVRLLLFGTITALALSGHDS